MSSLATIYTKPEHDQPFSIQYTKRTAKPKPANTKPTKDKVLKRWGQ